MYPGTYQFSTAILDKGGISAPFGGEYIYASKAPDGATTIGTGIFRLSGSTVVDAIAGCGQNKTSFVSVDRKADGTYVYSICLSTTNGGWLSGTRAEVDDNSSTKKNQIFCGKADTTGKNTKRCPTE